MPELKNRKKEEEEIMAILLLIFASEDMAFWTSGLREPQWFEAKLQESPLTSRFRSISRRAQDQMLRELKREVLRTPINDRMGHLSDFYKYDIAGRMAKRHAEWLTGFEAEQRQREQDRRSGKKVREPDPPTIEEVYPPSWAEREAASTVTDWVSETEMTTGGVIEDTHKITLQAYWQTEPGACPICEPLDRQPREVWSKKFPRGPKAHPNCILPGVFVRLPFGQTASIKSQYSGPVCDLCVGSQYFLSVTPKHPIPTANGMVAAGELREGDLVFVASDNRHPQGMHYGVSERLHDDARRYYERLYEEPQPAMLHGEAERMIDPIEIVMLPGAIQRPEMKAEEAIIAALKHKSIRYSPTPVTSIQKRHYEGAVYDFTAESLPFYLAGEVLVSNCRCWLEWSEVLNP